MIYWLCGWNSKFRISRFQDFEQDLRISKKISTQNVRNFRLVASPSLESSPHTSLAGKADLPLLQSSSRWLLSRGSQLAWNYWKSWNLTWNLEILLEIQKSCVKSRNLSRNPEIQCEILRFRNLVRFFCWKVHRLCRLPPTKGKVKSISPTADRQIAVVQAADFMESRKLILDLATWLWNLRSSYYNEGAGVHKESASLHVSNCKV